MMTDLIMARSAMGRRGTDVATYASFVCSVRRLFNSLLGRTR